MTPITLLSLFDLTTGDPTAVLIGPGVDRAVAAID